MGLADRDYMRERAQQRRDKPPRNKNRKAISFLPIILLSCIVQVVLHFSNHRSAEKSPVGVPISATVVAQQSPISVGNTPSAQVELEPSLTGFLPSQIPQGESNQPEIVRVLNGARTQDLSHVVASTVGDTGGHFPANGSVEWFVPLDPSHQTGRLTIIDQDGTQSAKLIRIRQAETGFVIVQIYIQAEQGGFIDLPLGNYTLTVAKGDRWYGRPKYFGPEGAYFNSLQLIQMTPNGVTEQLLPPNGEGRRMIQQPSYAF